MKNSCRTSTVTRAGGGIPSKKSAYTALIFSNCMMSTRNTEHLLANLIKKEGGIYETVSSAD